MGAEAFQTLLNSIGLKSLLSLVWMDMTTFLCWQNTSDQFETIQSFA